MKKSFGNKIVALIVALCLVVSVAVLGACSFLGGNTLIGGEGNHSGTNTNPVKINNTASEAESYNSISSNDVTETVADIVMPSTYEITSILKYSYSRNSGIWGGSSGTISASATYSGTGFVIDEEGYLVTNAHVICYEDADTLPNFQYTSREIYVNLADSAEQLECEIISYDEVLDLCLLKIKKSGTDSEGKTYEVNNDFIPVRFFCHDDPSDTSIDAEKRISLRYGETVIAIGNAKGYGIAVTTGVVSAPFRQFVDSGNIITKAIQTDTAINPGNSGGPLLNSFAAVIGINSFKIVEDETENMGYAIPTYVITAFLDSIAEGTYDKINTLGADGAKFSGTVKANYFVTSERAYSASGENVVSKY